MSTDLDVLEALRAQMARNAQESAPYVPGWSQMMRAISVTVERALNAHLAAELGLAKPRDVVMAAHRALVALESYVERGVVSGMGKTHQYTAERAALCRLAGVPEEE